VSQKAFFFYCETFVCSQRKFWNSAPSLQAVRKAKERGKKVPVKEYNTYVGGK
jgi:hypothetical protein